MHITCPDCQYRREIPDEKLPARAQMATCPKCGLKFQFRELPPPSIFDAARVQARPDTPAGEDGGPGPLAPGGPGLWDHAEAPAAPPAAQTPPGTETAPLAPEPPRAETREQAVPDPAPGPMPGPSPDPTPDPTPEPAPGPMPDPTPERSPDPVVVSGFAWGASGDEDTALPPVPPPFEELEEYGFFPGLWQTIRRVLLAPRLFFQAMPLNRGIMRPLVFYLLLAEFQALAELFWGLAGLTGMPGVDDAPMEGTTGRVVMGVSSAVILVLYPLMLTAALFVGATLNHLCLTLLRSAQGGFEATFRAMAYSSAPFILCLVPVAGPLAAALWSFLVAVIGYKHLHRTTYGRVLGAMAIPVLLLMVLALAIMRSNAPTI